MPKTPSNKLFHLIKSLSGSEKRYFKLFVHHKGGKENKYIQLFEAIETQETFDEESLKRLVYKGEPIQSRKYSELKAYLYDLIFKSLQAYDEKCSVDYKVKSWLQSVRVAYRRSLFNDAKDILQKARKLCLKYEDFSSLLEILDWEKQIAYAQTDITYLDREIERIREEERYYLDQLQRISDCRNAFLELLIALRKDASRRRADQRAAIDHLFEKYPGLEDGALATNHQAKIFRHRFFALYHYSRLEFKAFNEWGEQLMTLMEEKKHMLKEEVSEYISGLSNYALSCLMLKDYEALKKCLKKFKTLEPNTMDDQVKIHRQYYTFMFRLCINTGDFEQGLMELKDHLREVRKFDAGLFEKGNFYFQYFYIYFGTGNYNNALEYLNEWLNLPNSIERKDLQSLARILNLIIHYEMQNTWLVDSLLRSTQRFLSKENKLFELEKQIVTFIREVNNITSKKERKLAFTEMRKSIEKLKEIPSERAMLQLFDFEAWLDCRVQNKSFAQIVREKYQQQHHSVKN